MNILVTGKKGTGKTVLVEILAKLLHDFNDNPVLYVDCAKTQIDGAHIEALESHKGNTENHLLVSIQSKTFLRPDIADKFDAHVALESQEIGKWLHSASWMIV